jgi:hypothetical protein
MLLRSETLNTDRSNAEIQMRKASTNRKKIEIPYYDEMTGQELNTIV